MPPTSQAGHGPPLTRRLRRNTPRTGRGLITTGLVAQVVGVSTQALWHTLLSGSPSGLLTEDRTFLIDHTISNLGVAAMVVGARRLHRAQPGLGSRVVATGTGLEVAGALGDLIGHARGSESPLAFAFIGAGFVTSAVGVVMASRRGSGRGSAVRVDAALSSNRHGS